MLQFQVVQMRLLVTMMQMLHQRMDHVLILIVLVTVKVMLLQMTVVNVVVTVLLVQAVHIHNGTLMVTAMVLTTQLNVAMMVVTVVQVTVQMKHIHVKHTAVHVLIVSILILLTQQKVANVMNMKYHVKILNVVALLHLDIHVMKSFTMVMIVLTVKKNVLIKLYVKMKQLLTSEQLVNVTIHAKKLTLYLIVKVYVKTQLLLNHGQVMAYVTMVHGECIQIVKLLVAMLVIAANFKMMVHVVSHLLDGMLVLLV